MPPSPALPTHTHTGALSGVTYAVFGVGNSQWAQTFQAFPKKVAVQMVKAGAHEVCVCVGGGEAACVWGAVLWRKKGARLCSFAVDDNWWAGLLAAHSSCGCWCSYLCILSARNAHYSTTLCACVCVLMYVHLYVCMRVYRCCRCSRVMLTAMSGWTALTRGARRPSRHCWSTSLCSHPQATRQQVTDDG